MCEEMAGQAPSLGRALGRQSSWRRVPKAGVSSGPWRNTDGLPRLEQSEWWGCGRGQRLARQTKGCCFFKSAQGIGFYPKWDGTLLGSKIGERHALIYVLK